MDCLLAYWFTVCGKRLAVGIVPLGGLQSRASRLTPSLRTVAAKGCRCKQAIAAKESAVTNIINQIIQLLQQGVAAIFKFLQLVWVWSFGQIVQVFQSDWQALPVWKIVVLVVVVIGIAYLLYQAAVQLWAAVVSLFKSFIALLTAFVLVLPYVVIAGLIAFAGGWVIQSINI
jgi:hypothetical protein